LMTKNWKIYSLDKNLIFFWSKIAIYLSIGLHKGCPTPSYRRSLQPLKFPPSTSKMKRNVMLCLCACSFQDIGDDKIQLVQAMSGKANSCSNLDLSIPNSWSDGHKKKFLVYWFIKSRVRDSRLYKADPDPAFTTAFEFGLEWHSA
jgi:hypothetical protein